MTKDRRSHKTGHDSSNTLTTGTSSAGPARCPDLTRGLGNTAYAQAIGVGSTTAGADTGSLKAASPATCDGTVAEQIRDLVDYTAFDWAVVGDEEVQIVSLLKGDSCLAATINDLDSDGALARMLDRVDGAANRRDLLQRLGGGIIGPTLERVSGLVGTELGADWLTVLRLASHGADERAPAFDASVHSGLISSDPSAPFTGVGATGTNPTSLSIPLMDQGRLAAGHQATVDKYSNPLGGLDTYLSGLSDQERADQATLLCNQPISSVHPEIYGDELPSRAQVMRAAAAAHNLHPELIAAIILAEQRDQSQLEDAKDYTGATSLLQGNTSIGLGQVVVSTAQNNDLFSDLLDQQTRSGLDHDDTARLLASDEYNIFATAKYLRKVADDGATKTATNLPTTVAEYPNVDFPAYAANSSTWPADNIGAIGSEYTSRAWDDHLSTGWGMFVQEAYNDVTRAGIF